MTNNRLEYIDVAKGLLITIVVMSHVPSYAMRAWGNPIFPYIKSCDYWFIPFFMPAFFVITGFCSNHNKKFIYHLIANFRTTILPAMAICLLLKILGAIVRCDIKTLLSFLDPVDWIKWPANVWFFSSLFICKELYWLINRFVNPYAKMLILFIVTSVGVYYGRNDELANYWYWKQALAFSIFIGIGDLLKVGGGIKKLFRYFGYTYPFVIFVLHFFSQHIPGIGFHFRIDIQEILLYIILAFAGALFIINVSELLEKSRLLNFLGYWSGFIYGIHFYILGLVVIPILSKFFIPTTALMGLSFYIIAIVLTIIICSIFIKCFDFKYTRFFLGKI